MIMSRIVAIRRPDGGLPADVFPDGAYTVHNLIWSFFPGTPKGTPCPLHRFEAKPSPHFYVVSKTTPSDESGSWEVRSQTYDPKLSVGDRLEFTVRVNPVVTRHDEQGKQKRHDVVMDAKNALKKAGREKNSWPLPVEMWREAVFGWLRARCTKHGFEFADGDVRVDGYQSSLVWSRKQKDPIRISTVELSGALTVTDPALFRHLLFHGLGPAKGFGCGLMLVKRARA
jgi:CRISPR system Cascade subunit CasE